MTQIRARRRLSTNGAGYQPVAAKPGEVIPPPPAPKPKRVQPVAATPEVIRAPAAWKHVTRALYHGKQLLDEQHEEEVIAVPAFEGPVGYVNVDGGITKNMGDFNSVRVRVSISLPVYPVDSEIRRAFQHASNLLDDLLPSELDKAMGIEQPAE